jgi:hypothetical protein
LIAEVEKAVFRVSDLRLLPEVGDLWVFKVVGDIAISAKGVPLPYIAMTARVLSFSFCMECNPSKYII